MRQDESGDGTRVATGRQRIQVSLTSPALAVAPADQQYECLASAQSARRSTVYARG